jgi:hypothetical protein
MGGAYPYMDLNAKYGKLLLRFYYDFTAIDSNKDISKTRQVHVKYQLVNKMSRFFVLIPLYVVGKINGGDR